MAYVNTQDDQTQVSGGTNAQPPPQTSSTGVGGASSPQGVSSVSATTKAPPVQDLHAYLTANAPQAVQAGQNIGNNLSATANKVTGDINADQSAVDQGVQAQNVAPNQDLVNQAAANPTAFASDPNNVAAFQAQENANYTGPQTYESTGNYQGLQNEVTDAVNSAPDINKPGGITQLVTGQEKNPTIGKENLDSLLLQENPNALAPIKSALAKYPTLNSYLSNAAQTEDTNIQQAIANDQAAPQYVNQQFFTGQNAVVPGFQNALQSNLQDETQGANTYNNTVGQNIQTANPIEQQLQKYMAQSGVSGISDPLSAILAQKAIDAPTLANASSTSDYAKNAALEQLLGNRYSPFLSDADASQGGTFSVPTIDTANAGSLAQQIADNATQSTYSQKVQPQIQGALAQIRPGNNPYNGTSVAGNWPTYEASLQNNANDTSPVSESNFIANGQPAPLNERNFDFYNETNPSSTGYNSLLEYLQGLNPSGISGSKGGNYSVNS